VARPRVAFRSLRVHPEFRDFVLDQLSRVPDLRWKTMFGGIGLYSGERFFGIVAADELFFKVDGANRAAYEAAGSEPFKPVLDRPVSMSYWRVPLDVLEDSEVLQTWARDAIRAAESAARKSRKRKKKRVTKSTATAKRRR
jgi:DNA transformation protein